MFVQVGFQSEGLVAASTDVWLGIGVSLNVGSQIRLVSKGLLANVAGKRFFSCNYIHSYEATFTHKYYNIDYLYAF